MKVFAVVASLVAACYAQNAFIGAPAANTTVVAGQNITVEMDKPDTLTGSQEVALVLSMVRCPPSSANCTSPDYDPSEIIGDVLYNGPYNPQFQNNGAGGKPPYQNFSVQVPPSFTSGEQVALIATHLNLVGAGPFANLQVLFVPLTVA